MSERHYEFPEYGDGGDVTGARRSRRTFRIAVTSLCALTFILWFSENFLRYDSAERKYRSALTLHPESARSFLRSAVKDDKENREKPRVQYIEALAAREEEDNILPRFAEAHELEPGNAQLSIRYGVALYLRHRPQQALELFRSAAESEPKNNALARYLEAAALAATKEGLQDPSQPLALVARANNAGQKVVFPSPMWFPGLPTDGFRYAQLRRDLIDECCAPLNQFVRTIVEKGKHDDINPAWLSMLATMGERIATATTTDAAQVADGVWIQARTLKALRKMGGGDFTREELDARIERIDSAHARIIEFEDERQERIKTALVGYRRPLQLARDGVLLSMLCYFLARILNRLFGKGQGAWTLPHPPFTRYWLSGAAAVTFLLLIMLSVYAASPDKQIVTVVIWKILMGLTLIVGLAVPWFTLPKAAQVCEGKTVETGGYDDMLREAHARRKTAAWAFIRRYYGLWLGILLCVICLWSIMYRIHTDLYPWNLQLLVPGLVREEKHLVSEVLRTLGTS